MTPSNNHISVCVCTYKRPELLKHLLDSLAVQQTEGLFTYSIVIVDNDGLRSAEPVVTAFAASTIIPITYCLEARQNIALARNRAVESATGDFIAFVDDDEFTTDRWLQTLFTICVERNVDGVLGPVKPYFEIQPPSWVTRGRFHDRQTYPTGLVIDWRKGRTGNTLLRRKLFDETQPAFRPEFRNGEDQEFFHRMISRGHVFIWCNEAVAYEIVPAIRWKRTFMLRRALLRGAIEPLTPGFGFRDILKSLVAVPIYTFALPFGLLIRHDIFMNALIRLCDHLGRLLAIIGINPIKEAYVTE
jgi:succinoglycan biosynthesis protein ExoM